MKNICVSDPYAIPDCLINCTGLITLEIISDSLLVCQGARCTATNCEEYFMYTDSGSSHIEEKGGNELNEQRKGAESDEMNTEQFGC